MRTTRWRWPRHAALVCAITLACGTVMTGAAHAAAGSFTIRAGSLDIALNSTGTVTKLIDTADHRDYASSANPEPLIQLMVDGSKQKPTRLTYDSASSTYTFAFGAKGVKVGIHETSKSGYATLEATSVSAPSGVDVQTLLWGPITTSITQTVGETVGVVHDGTFAIGIHELNDKTVGGWPDEFDSQTFTNVTPEASLNWPFGWFAAHQTSWGSFLQAYTYDYSKTRTRYVGWSDMHEPTAAVPPLAGPDGRITGSKIALFGTTPGNVLPTLSGIETSENLPHPMIDGQWGKVSQGASQSWLVLSDLNTGNVDQASLYARKAGMKYIYSLPGVDGPWQSAGHYQFNSSFGGSDAGAASLAATAAANGISVGVHSLSNLIDTDDSYVTPTADAGLATFGSAALTRPAAAGDTTIYVSDDAMFSGGQGSILRIGTELLTYNSVSQVSGTEWQVSVNRGAYGTTPAAYSAGATTSRIQQYAYGMLTGGISQIPQISSRLSQVLDIPNIKALSYDGLEDASLAGYGLMSTAKLVNGVYQGQHAAPDTITEASNLLPNTWDAQGRVSWGEHNLNTDPNNEPISLQPYYQRNYMAGMMGWLGFGAGDSLQYQEWQLSKMAAYNAGAGLETSVGELNNAGDANQIMDSWNQWESARNAGAFTAAQQAEMKDINSYWHLGTTVPGKSWNLYNVQYPATLSASNDGKANTWPYTNAHAAQPLQFQLRASGGAVSKVVVTLNGTTVTYTADVPSGGYLVADGTGAAGVYDGTWHSLGAATVSGSASYTAGKQNITLTATGSGTSAVRFLTDGSPEKVTAPATVSAPAAVSSGAAVTVTTHYTNTTVQAQKNVSTVFDAPTGWIAAATTPAAFGSVAPGQSVSTTWTLTPPANEASASYTVTAQTTYAGAAREDRVLAGFTVGSGSLPSAFDNIGISDDATPGAGDFDGNGISYSAQALAAAGLTPGGTVSHKGVSFTWPHAATGQMDNVFTAGQTIRLSGSGNTLAFLGASSNGATSGNGTVTYTDGTSQPYTLTLPDWTATTLPAGVDVAATMPYRNDSSGKRPQPVNVFYASVPIQSGKTIQSVTLPSISTQINATPAMHIFAMTVATP